MKRTAASEQKRLHLLLKEEELGDRKPSQVLRRMQQLLGEKAGAIDVSLFRELFLQHLPANVRMVLASVSDTVILEDLAQLTDRITEVAAVTSPAIAALGASQRTTEIDELRSEITSLKQVVLTLAKGSARALLGHGFAARLHHQLRHRVSAGTTDGLEAAPGSAHHPVHGRKTRGDGCNWP